MTDQRHKLWYVIEPELIVTSIAGNNILLWPSQFWDSCRTFGMEEALATCLTLLFSLVTPFP